MAERRATSNTPRGRTSKSAQPFIPLVGRELRDPTKPGAGQPKVADDKHIRAAFYLLPPEKQKAFLAEERHREVDKRYQTKKRQKAKKIAPTEKEGTSNE